MRLRRAGLRPFALPLARELSTAHGVVATRRGWLVWLEDEHGNVGLGEATPLADFGTESHATCEAALGRLLSSIADGDGGPLDLALEERLERLAPLRLQTPCAVAAIDTALHDLAARHEALSLAGWLRLRAGDPGPPAAEIAVQALIGGETPGQVAEATRCARKAGFTTFKLKLAVSGARQGEGRRGEAPRGEACRDARSETRSDARRDARDVVVPGDPGADRERVAALREAAGREARLRLDANEAWTRAEAAAALESLAPFGIDYVEQPVARGDLESLAWLAAESPVAVAADESLLGAGLEACLERGAASILILKPAALGGLGPARPLVARARAAGLRLVWSTLLDGAIGRAAVWHLAAGLGPADEVHGLATGDWLARDLVPTPAIQAGRLGAPGAGPGLGLGLGLRPDDPSDPSSGGGPSREEGSSERAEELPWSGPARHFGIDP